MEGILPSGVMESFAEEVISYMQSPYEHGSICKPPIIPCTASLAYRGLLCSVENLRLSDKDDVVDLSSVPAEHLASLVSIVTRLVEISNVIGCDLVTILDSVESKELDISSQSLGSEETQALVRAMESSVEQVGLSQVTLDIRDLMDYNGQGKCWFVGCYSDTKDRYREQLRTWTTSRNWEVTFDHDMIFNIQRCGPWSQVCKGWG